MGNVYCEVWTSLKILFGRSDKILGILGFISPSVFPILYFKNPYIWAHTPRQPYTYCRTTTNKCTHQFLMQYAATIQTFYHIDNGMLLLGWWLTLAMLTQEASTCGIARLVTLVTFQTEHLRVWNSQGVVSAKHEWKTLSACAASSTCSFVNNQDPSSQLQKHLSVYNNTLFSIFIFCQFNPNLMWKTMCSTECACLNSSHPMDKVCHRYTKGWDLSHHNRTLRHCTHAGYGLKLTLNSCSITRNLR